MKKQSDKGSEPTANVRGKEMTWSQVLKEYGPDAAAVAAPQLDPRYQELVKTEGQAKGSEDYARQYVDPMTERPSSPLVGTGDIQGGIQQERQRGGLVPTALADLGSFITSGAGFGGIGTALLGGGGAGAAAPAGKGGKPKPAVTTAQPAAPSAAEALMNSLVSQYQSAMSQVNPYISGQVGSQAVSNATATAAGAGGPNGPAPSTEGPGLAMIANDASAYEKANATGAALTAQALKDTGTANALALKVDPYMGILQALQSEAQYKTETGAPPTSITGTKMPAWLSQIYQNTIGSTPGGAAAVGGPVVPPPVSGATSTSTPSTNTPSVAGGGNG